jgi:hypothetical protein
MMGNEAADDYTSYYAACMIIKSNWWETDATKQHQLLWISKPKLYCVS